MSGVKNITAAALMAAIAAGEAQADTVRIRNKGRDHLRLSDLFAFSGVANTGARTVVMRKNFNGDDVNIAINGSKSITVPDGTRSVTVSFRKNGKEVESDMNLTGGPIDLAFFNPMGATTPDVAVVFDPAGGALPDIGSFLTIAGGKLADPQFNWITFYDAGGNGGFVERDPAGNIISPVLSTGEVVVEGHYGVRLVPAPGSLALVGAGGLLAARRRRRA